MPNRDRYPRCTFHEQGYDCFARYTESGYRTKCCHVLNGMSNNTTGCPFHKSMAQFKYEQTQYPYDESKSLKEEKNG